MVLHIGIAVNARERYDTLQWHFGTADDIASELDKHTDMLLPLVSLSEDLSLVPFMWDLGRCCKVAELKVVEELKVVVGPVSLKVLSDLKQSRIHSLH